MARNNKKSRETDRADGTKGNKCQCNWLKSKHINNVTKSNGLQVPQIKAATVRLEFFKTTHMVFRK